MSELFQDLYIFEVANNHQGSVEHGLKIIQAMAKIARRNGIRAGVKFQYRDLDSFIHPEFRERKDVPHIPRFLETRLAAQDFKVMVDECRQQGLITICTPFDEASVGAIVDQGIQIIKVASCSASDWPLLQRIAEANKPVIASTGGRAIYDIDNLVSFLTHRSVDFALMHCVGVYPTPSEDVQLDFMSRMIRRYPYLTVGYSGHEAPDNLDVVKVAVAKGAGMLERHVGVPTDTIKLNKYSMNPDETEAWVKAAELTRRICGSTNGHDKRISQAEVDSLLSLARGAYAARDIAMGETITRDAVYFAMPCAEGQTTSGDYQETMVATRDYKANEGLRERRTPSAINAIRGIMHDAKGMLYEANIDFGKDFTIELSHHYGIEHFRQWGALIVNVINREYCKKLIVVLPGQKHPVHFHKQKEETFHVLWGDLDAVVNDIPYQLKRGDKLLLERGDRHSFTSRGGCIFEEISTTHVVGDSFYEDERVARLDPIQRKTVLEEW